MYGHLIKLSNPEKYCFFILLMRKLRLIRHAAFPSGRVRFRPKFLYCKAKPSVKNTHQNCSVAQLWGHCLHCIFCWRFSSGCYSEAPCIPATLSNTHHLNKSSVLAYKWSIQASCLDYSTVGEFWSHHHSLPASHHKLKVHEHILPGGLFWNTEQWLPRLF